MARAQKILFIVPPLGYPSAQRRTGLSCNNIPDRSDRNARKAPFYRDFAPVGLPPRPGSAAASMHPRGHGEGPEGASRDARSPSAASARRSASATPRGRPALTQSVWSAPASKQATSKETIG